jgi:putative transcriptional regulator
MSKSFASIKQGLQEAIVHQRGKQSGVKLHVPPAVDVYPSGKPILSR